MKIELTDRYLKSLAPPDAGRFEVSDTKRVGLRFRLSANGNGTFIDERRIKGGGKQKVTIGSYPKPISLADARRISLEIQAEASRGYSRVEADRSERIEREVVAAKRKTVSEAIEAYAELHLTAKLRTADERLRQLNWALEPYLTLACDQITRSQLQSRVDQKASDGAPFAANRIQAALSAFAKWAWQRDYLSENIGAGLTKPIVERPRDLVLSIHEVRTIWAATQEMGELWGPLFRLLIITAQRRGDITGLRWSEVSEGRIEISASRTKNGKAHIVPLSDPARAEIESLNRAHGLVFTTTGRTPVSGFSKAKARLDKLLGDDFRSWRLHDIRTAFATAMADAGEPEGVVDRVLNHVASVSSASAVARTYNRAELLPQRARVLDRWAEMVTGERGAVVQLEGRGK